MHGARATPSPTNGTEMPPTSPRLVAKGRPFATPSPKKDVLARSLARSFGVLIHVHRLDDPLRATNRSVVVMEAPHSLLLILCRSLARLHRRRVRLVRVHVPQLHIIPPGLARPGARLRDPLLALAADVSRVVEMLHLAAGDGAGSAVVEAVFGFDARGAGFEGAEAEDAADEGPEVGEVDDDEGGGGFAGVPV